MRIRAQITEKLFWAKPTFCPYLMEICSYVNELSIVSMAWANPNHLYQLDEYADLQVVTREQKAKPALENVVEKVQQVRCTQILRLTLHAQFLTETKSLTQGTFHRWSKDCAGRSRSRPGCTKNPSEMFQNWSTPQELNCFRVEVVERIGAWLPSEKRKFREQRHTGGSWRRKRCWVYSSAWLITCLSKVCSEHRSAVPLLPIDLLSIILAPPNKRNRFGCYVDDK